MTGNRLTLDQYRATHALKQVDQLKDLSLAEKYKTYVESLSATVVMNGLGQTCATLLAQAKGESGEKDAHRLLYDHVEEWLCSSVAGVGLAKPLMHSLVQSDQSRYCHAQSEALAYLVWLKKFAQAFLSKPVKGNGDGKK